jgi:hypothetical protein
VKIAQMTRSVRMRAGRGARILGFALTVLILGGGAVPDARAACTTTICTGGNPCTISGTNTIDDGCILNFGSSQDVLVTGTMRTASDDEGFTIQAHSIDISGTLRARGDFGSIWIETTGSGDPFIKTSGSGNLDVVKGGEVVLDAAGTVDIGGGAIDADGATGSCDGGEVTITGTSVVITRAIHADGASCGGPGGSITITATDTSVSLSGAGGVTANGGGSEYDGGAIAIDAVTTISQGKAMQARGSGDGWGGTIGLTSSSTGASGLITIGGAMNASGGGGADSRGGDISVDGGEVTTNDTLTANGGYFDAGTITLWATGAIDVNAGITAEATNSGYGGSIEIDADDDVTIDGQISANAGGADSGAGTVDIRAGSNAQLTVNNAIEAKATSNGAFDGTILLDACDIVVDDGVRTRNTSVGLGLNHVLYAGTLTVTSGGSLLADDPAPTVCPASPGFPTNGNFIRCRCPDANTDGICDSLTCVSAPTLTGTVTPTALICPTVMPACS